MTLRVTTHTEAARRFARTHCLRVSELPGRALFSSERVTLGSHDGTHLDAPYHFYPTSEGARAKRIDEVPLEWAFGNGLVLDFRHKAPTEAITEYDVASALEGLGRQPQPGDIVMLWTGGTDGFDDDPRFSDSAAGLNGGALNYLFRLGVRIMSTDSATIDMPIAIMREKFKSGDSAAYFPIHRAGRLTEWTHAEKLANMGSLPAPYGFKVMLFPIKIAGGTGAWIRAVGIEDSWLDSTPVRLIDLSLPIMNHSFEPEPSHIDTVHHGLSRRRQAKLHGMKTGDIVHASAMDVVETYTQAGTHVAAPAHFRDPEHDGAMSVDRVPLDWFYGDGVLLDFSQDKRPGERIGRTEIQAKLDRSGASVSAETIVLVKTGAADAFDDDPSFPDLAPALDGEAFTWLLDRGVRVVGSDCESLDGPVGPMVEALRAGRPDAFFPVHRAGRDRDFCLIHKMDLRGLTQHRGFKVAAFPIKLEDCGSAWTRAVALVPAGS